LAISAGPSGDLSAPHAATVFQQAIGGALNQQLDGAGQRPAAMQALHDHQPQHHARAIDAAPHFPSASLL